MRKELCMLTENDVQGFVDLLSNYYTFNTLKNIESLSNNKNDLIEITNTINDLEKKIQQYKKDLLLKYNVPYYVSTPMHIDIQKGVIYINEGGKIL